MGFNNFGRKGRSSTKLCHVTYHEAGLKFGAAFDFNRDYLWNEFRCRQSETNLIDSYPFRIEQKMVNFCPLTAKLCWPMCTHPKSTKRAILDNFRI